MGVPSFFRWLVKKYPKVVSDVIEERPVEADGVTVPVDLTQPNPNHFETDNLYLDMNGIIHPCCHPEDSEAPDDEDEMIRRIFDYTDRIFGMVRPRQLLYMAIDGVAPRAKMNQQRSRRFRAAKEMKEKEELEDKLRREWEAEGRTLPPRKRKPWDSNVITPGTQFMHNLSVALHYYVADRIQSVPAWKGIKVIFSDAKVPGEGEHKIMRFIRNQRAQPGYNPNTSHALYGMDADLIMLGLATHDPYFRIIRETIVEAPRRCQLCGQEGHYMDQCTGEAKAPVEVHEVVSALKPFQFLHISILREYLAQDLRVNDLPFEFELERVIDDFVFLCFFVGNDFLPHLPSLEIREGAIERLCGIYKRLLPSMGGYVSENGVLDLSRVDVLLTDLGVVEDNILKARKVREEQWKARDREKMEKIKRIKEERAAGINKIVKFAEDQGMRPVNSQQDRKRKLKDEEEGTEAEDAPHNGATKVEEEEAKESHTDDSKETEEEQREEESNMQEDDEEAAEQKRQETNRAGEKQTKKASRKRRKEAQARGEDGTEAPVTVVVSEETDKSTTKVKKEKKDKKSKRNTNSEDTATESQSATSTAPSSNIEADLAALDDGDSAEEEEDPVAVTPSPLKETKHLTERILAAAPEPTGDPQTDFAASLNARLKEIAEPAQVEDQIRFGEDGWKDRYYAVKMKVSTEREEDLPMLRRLFSSYAEGLSWVMLYYYRGCASWSWYYPFHYAPMAGDLRNLDRFKQEFELASPFSPMGQLMGVLPAASSHCMPEACRELMLNPNSPIADFYPEDFPLDLNGKKYLWQAVALLPWIDEKRLLSELKKVEPTFNAEEKNRNEVGEEYLFVHSSHRMANTVSALHLRHSGKLKKLTRDERAKLRKELNADDSSGLFGYIAPYAGAITPGSTLRSTVGMETLTKLPVVSCVVYLAPEAEHRSQLLEGLIPPPAVLTEHDFKDSNRGGRREHQPRLGENAQFMASQEQWSRQQQQQQQGPGGQFTIRMLEQGNGNYSYMQQQQYDAPPPTYAGHSHYDQFIRRDAQQQQQQQQQQPANSHYYPPPMPPNMPNNRTTSYPPYPVAPYPYHQSPYPPAPYYAPPPSYPSPPVYPYGAPPPPSAGGYGQQYGYPQPPMPYTFSKNGGRGASGPSQPPMPPPPMPYTFAPGGQGAGGYGSRR